MMTPFNFFLRIMRTMVIYSFCLIQILVFNNNKQNDDFSDFAWNVIETEFTWLWLNYDRKNHHNFKGPKKVMTFDWKEGNNHSDRLNLWTNSFWKMTKFIIQWISKYCSNLIFIHPESHFHQSESVIFLLWIVIISLSYFFHLK